MKTTMAEYDPATHGPKITYKEIDASLVKPVKRDYTGKTPAAPPSEAASKPAAQGAH